VTGPAISPASRRPVKPRPSLLVPGGLLATLLITLWAAWAIGFDLGEIAANWHRGIAIIGEVLNVDWSFFPRTVEPMLQTVQIAIVAAIVGCAVALPFAFVASRVTAPNGWSMTIDRWLLNVVRALPDLLYAMIFVAALSVGPTAGILALIFFNLGVMAKLLSETVDAVDTGPMEAARASGAAHLQAVRSSVLPQVLPSYVAFALYIFELNIRASTVIGLTGAGGIGVLLGAQLARFNFPQIGMIILEIFVIVLLIELASNALRRRLI
jgi:phosphonate transport system permease protein